MRAWVYKINSRVGRWHFDRYFRYRGRSPYDMGGEGWVRSPLSWRCLRRVRRGDLFVCYQADERKIYGLARTASDGYEGLPDSGRCDSVDFTPRGLRLAHPLDVTRPPARLVFRHIRAFTVPSRGTVHALARDEWRALLAELVRANPGQRAALLAFTRR